MMILLAAAAGLARAATLLETCREILENQTLRGEKWGKTFVFTRPGMEKYGPYQWLWDSAFHAIAWSRIDTARAVQELRTLLKSQRSDGFIPEMTFWGHESAKDMLVNELLYRPDRKATQITQMPMLPFVLFRLFEETEDLGLLREFLPALVKYHLWWKEERQPDQDGLVVIIHPWESGLDASPLYDEALGVGSPQPSLKQMYPQFYELLVSYQYLYDWDQTRIVNNRRDVTSQKLKQEFVFKDVGVNAVYAYGWRLLSLLAENVDPQQAKLYQRLY